MSPNETMRLPPAAAQSWIERIFPRHLAIQIKALEFGL
jgi:hypothetical protein